MASERLTYYTPFFLSEDLEASLRHSKIVGQYGIPPNCDCVAAERVDDMILAFIALCEHHGALSWEEKDEITTCLKLVKTMSAIGAQDNGPKFLGRLEIIHRLANSFRAKVPGSTEPCSDLNHDHDVQDSDSNDSEDDFLICNDDEAQGDGITRMIDLNWEW